MCLRVPVPRGAEDGSILVCIRHLLPLRTSTLRSRPCLRIARIHCPTVRYEFSSFADSMEPAAARSTSFSIRAASLDRQQFEMRICCMRREGDPLYDFDQRTAAQELDYCEVRHRGALDRHVLSKLSRVVGQFGPDLIHSHDYKASFYATRLARRFRTSRLATAHGWTGHTARERWLYYPADKLHLSRSPGVIAVSNEIRRTLLSRGAPPDRVCVVLNAVDLERYERDETVRRAVRAELGLDDSEVVLGAVGRIEPQKRFDLLLQTFAKLHEQRPETRLLIAGEGSQFQQIERLVAQHRLQSVCRMLGHCPAITRTYQAFDLLVQSSDYEGTPTVVVEAMALGIPIVATRAGGTEQLLQDRIHGRLVPCRDTVALHRAITETLDDRPAAAERAAAAPTRGAGVELLPTDPSPGTDLPPDRSLRLPLRPSLGRRRSALRDGSDCDIIRRVSCCRVGVASNAIRSVTARLRHFSACTHCIRTILCLLRRLEWQNPLPTARGDFLPHHFLPP